MLVLTLTLALAGRPTAPEDVPPPRAASLGSAQAVRTLTPHEAALKRPVRLVGVVSYYEPKSFYLFLQDQTAGIFVQPHEVIPDLAIGERVEVVGVTDPGRFSPIVRATSIRRLGFGTFFGRYPFNLSLEDSRWLDAQRVEVWAEVRDAQAWQSFCRLRIESDHGTANLLVPGVHHLEDVRKLVGRAIHARGVCSARVDDDRAVIPPPAVYVQHPNFVTVLPTTAPGDVPWLAEHLTRFSTTPTPGGRRVKVAGVVIAAPDDRTAFVQDSSGGVCVQTDAVHGLTVGDEVEVVGSLRFNRARASLTSATVRVRGRKELPPAQARTVADLAAGRHFGTRATVEATVTQVRHDDRHGCVLSLAEGASRFDVLLPGGISPGAVPQLVAGTRVRVTGAVGFHEDLADGSRGFVLWVSSPDAVVTLRTPPAEPWWDSSRVRGLAAAVAVVGAAAIAWISLLRRQVRCQTAQLRAQHEQERLLDARYRDLFESAGDAVWVTDAEGRRIVRERDLAELGTRETRGQSNVESLAAPDSINTLRKPRKSRHGQPSVVGKKLVLIVRTPIEQLRLVNCSLSKNYRRAQEERADQNYNRLDLHKNPYALAAIAFAPSTSKSLPLFTS